MMSLDRNDLFTQYKDKRYWSFTDSSQAQNPINKGKNAVGEKYETSSVWQQKNCGQLFTE